MNLRDLLTGLPDDPRVVVSGNHATPWTALGEVDAVLPAYRLWALNGQVGLPDREGVVLETSFVGPGQRRSPQLHYVPCRLSLVPRLFERRQPPDLVVLHTTVPRAGRVSLGTEVNVLPAAVAAARARGGKVVVQANPRMPWTGGDALLSLDLVDAVVDTDEPLPVADPAPGDPTAERIGSLVAGLVADGSTLQAGIGAVPDAALRGLRDRRGLRVWTEMFSDSVLSLEQAGALDRDTPVTASFLFGSAELLEWVDGLLAAKTAQTGTGQKSGIHLACTQLVQSGVHIAAQKNNVQIRA